MTNRRKAALPIAAVSALAIVLPLGSPAAVAQTVRSHEKNVFFEAEHPCTRENVTGDTNVKITITETTNEDGTTTVHTKQHTHGQQLLGTISLDWYTFNNAQDVEESETIFGTSGSVSTKTHFIHTSEDVANAEIPGFDDFHQKLDVIINPLLPPVVVRDTGRCQ